MTYLLVLAHFSIVSLTDCTQKVPLFVLESLTRNSGDSFCAIHEIFVVLIHE